MTIKDNITGTTFGSFEEFAEKMEGMSSETDDALHEMQDAINAGAPLDAFEAYFDVYVTL